MYPEATGTFDIKYTFKKTNTNVNCKIKYLADRFFTTQCSTGDGDLVRPLFCEKPIFSR